MPISLKDLRRYAIARSLFKPTTLKRAIEKLGFVQADPIRAPARAQDLTLRHRVKDYRAGDLERRYPSLALEEDFFVNYGFLPRIHHALMHPRTLKIKSSPTRTRQAEAILAFVRERGAVHPREVDAYFSHGRVTNWFGGSSNASTQLLDHMHYRGLLRVARRDGGTRVYVAREIIAVEPAAGDAAAADAATADAATASSASKMDALVDVIVRKYAPLPANSLGNLVNRLQHGAPQWIKERAAALARAKQRLRNTRVQGIEWYWPAEERPESKRWATDDEVRLLTPFDPIVWDRRRFEIFWDWAYRFEAYTPEPKRKLGYYALPLLWHERVIGWGNLTVTEGRLSAAFGYTAGKAPRDPSFRAALDRELDRVREFLEIAREPV
ncbi:MAG TPA: crosslink repair DNA glycosylase YcaQ family protein [Steroidobacteraceae bacterium]|nr:crosslink repair DNA glycosylase YcaQ family protein [Steroidobacteraceae bacterium]